MAICQHGLQHLHYVVLIQSAISMHIWGRCIDNSVTLAANTFVVPLNFQIRIKHRRIEENIISWLPVPVCAWVEVWFILFFNDKRTRHYRWYSQCSWNRERASWSKITQAKSIGRVNHKQERQKGTMSHESYAAVTRPQAITASLWLFVFTLCNDC